MYHYIVESSQLSDTFNVSLVSEVCFWVQSSFLTYLYHVPYPSLVVNTYAAQVAVHP